MNTRMQSHNYVRVSGLEQANAKAAAAEMAFASPEAKAKALTVAADAIWVGRENILSANALDMEFGRSKGLSAAMMDRLELDADRIQSIVDGLRSIAVQEDPVGAVIDGWDMPSGLHIHLLLIMMSLYSMQWLPKPHTLCDL